MTTRTKAIGIEAMELELCRRSLWRFLDHVWLPDPPPEGKGIVKFQKWEHLRRLHEAVEATAPGGVLPHIKARKLGITSYFETRFIWEARFLQNAFMPVISQGEKEAMKVIADCKFIWEHLPEWMKRPLAVDNTSTLAVEGGGRIEAFPSTGKAGRSYTGTEILFDEAEFHEEFEASYNALLPLIQDTRGKMFVVTTANPDVMDSVCKRIYRRADNKFFLGYYARPNRTEATYLAARALASDDARFEKDNPRTEEEALAPAQALAAFDLNVLRLMEADIREPLERLGLANIYQRYVVGKRYMAGTDPSHGVGGDDAVTVVKDLATGYTVADIQGSNISPEELALQSVKLLQCYQSPIWGIEDNDWGVLVIRKAEELGYPRLYRRKASPGGREQVGWHTDDRSRYLLWGELIEAVHSRLLTLPSRAGLSQFWSVIRNPKKGGRIEALVGAKDDYPFAEGIAWQMRKEIGLGTVTPIHRF